MNTVKHRAKKITVNSEVVVVSLIVARVGNMDLNADQATKMINSIGWDAGNASMRAAGRAVWNRADYNAACRKANQLFRAAGLTS